MYIQDIFYNIKELSVEKKRELMLEAYNKSFNFHIDKLDVKESWSRQLIPNAEFKDYINFLDGSEHSVFIKRGGFYNFGEEIERTYSGEHCLEVGFATMNFNVDFYMFIYLENDYLDYFVNKYNIKPVN